jgi:hypothetical protein
MTKQELKDKLDTMGGCIMRIESDFNDPSFDTATKAFKLALHLRTLSRLREECAIMLMQEKIS